MPPIEGVGTPEVNIDFSQVSGPITDDYFKGMFSQYVPANGWPGDSSGGGVTGWLNTNAKTVLIGAGVLVTVLFLTGGRRR